MNRFKYRSRLPRPVRRPTIERGKGWQIGRPQERTPPEPGARIELSSPITINGGMRGTLFMRRPTPRDFAWFDRQSGSDSERTLKMMAHLCDVPQKIFDELYRSDPNGLLDACDAVMSED